MKPTPIGAVMYLVDDPDMTLYQIVSEPFGRGLSGATAVHIRLLDSPSQTQGWTIWPLSKAWRVCVPGPPEDLEAHT